MFKLNKLKNKIITENKIKLAKKNITFIKVENI